MTDKTKSRLAEAALVLGSVLLTLLLFEVLVMPRIIYDFPFDKRGFLPRPLSILAQTSKKGLSPENYVAVIGDSYAMGAGDWLFEPKTWADPPMLSQMLSKRTGRDVITLGKGGSDSVKGFVSEPVNFYDCLNRMWLYRVSRPELVLAVFYEGNDLYENLDRARRNFQAEENPERLRDPRELRRLIQEFADRRKEYDLFYNLVGVQFLNNLAHFKLDRLFKEHGVGRTEQINDIFTDQDKAAFAGTNQAILGGRPTELPPLLQGPGLGLAPWETNLALEIFRASAAYARDFFKGSRLFVVYVPSVLSCYELAGREVSDGMAYQNRRPALYPVSQVGPNHARIRSGVEAACASLGLPLLDATPSLRRAAAKGPIHGPKDFNHLDRRGYEALTEAVLSELAVWGAL